MMGAASYYGSKPSDTSPAFRAGEVDGAAGGWGRGAAVFAMARCAVGNDRFGSAQSLRSQPFLWRSHVGEHLCASSPPPPTAAASPARGAGEAFFPVVPLHEQGWGFASSARAARFRF